MNQRHWCGLLLLALVDCATHPPAPTTPVAPPATPAPIATPPHSVAALAAAISLDAARSDHERDSRIRGELADDAARDADTCLALEPQAVACRYGQALALGLAARTHPTRAGQLLTSMLDELARAEAIDPGYDEAGPARVRALVLIRAPAWPLGPGDTEAGVAAARRAVTLRPSYPPNLLALADALVAQGDRDGARQMYARARAAALALPESADRTDWLRQADRGMQQQ